MKEVNIFYFLSIILFFSCVKNEKKVQQQSIADTIERTGLALKEDSMNIAKDIILDPYAKGYPYDKLIDSISFVKLETTDNNLIGCINHLFFTNDKIVVVDMEVSKTITVYDRKGKFLYTISHRGAGPNEYRTLDYATLTLDQSNIVVVDMGANRLKYFSLDNATAKLTGSFLSKSVELPYIFTNVEYITDQIVAGYYSGGNIVPGKTDKQLFLITDLNKNIKYSGYKSFYNKNFTFTTRFPLRRFGPQLFFNPSFNDTIFNVTDKGLKTHYILNIKGNKKINIDETTENRTFSNELNQNNYFNSYFIELKDVAVFHYMSNTGRLNWGLYLKSENKTYDCSSEYKDPLAGFFNIPWFYYESNTLVMPIAANRLISHKDHIIKHSNKQLAKNLLDNLTEDDNPVLLFYHMKTKIK